MGRIDVRKSCLAAALVAAGGLLIGGTGAANAATCSAPSSPLCQLIDAVRAAPASSAATGTTLASEDLATLGDVVDKQVYSPQSCAAERTIEQQLGGQLMPEAVDCLSPSPAAPGASANAAPSVTAAADSGITFYRTSDAEMSLGDASGGNYNHKTRNFLRMRKCRFVSILGSRDDFPSCQARVWLARDDGSLIRDRTFFTVGGQGTLVGTSFDRTAGRALCEFLGGGDTKSRFGLPISSSRLTASCFYYFG
jgi:hypothetical protein